MYPTRSEFVNNDNNQQAVRIAELEMQLNHMSLERDRLQTGANRHLPYVMGAHPMGSPFIIGHPMMSHSMGGHVMIGHPIGGPVMIGHPMGRPLVSFMMGGPIIVPSGFIVRR